MCNLFLWIILLVHRSSLGRVHEAFVFAARERYMKTIMNYIAVIFE